MKKLFSLLLVLAVALSSAGAMGEALPAPTLFTPGTYEAEAQGFGGMVQVSVTVAENEITDVAIKGDLETPALGGVAVETMGEAIVKAQTPNVDGVSGATVTSSAIIAAATQALEAAGADIAVLDEFRRDTEENTVREDKTLDTDIVIIGAGGAGMAAAIMVQQAGKDFDDPALVQTLAEQSAGAIEWLDSIGADLPKISFSGGASTNRIHAPADGSAVGNYLVDKFSAKLKELGVEIMLNTKATELIMEDGKIAGVKAESQDANYTIRCKAVILATGGFGANLDMIASYRPDLQGTVTTNAPGATGDGIVMAQAVGAALVDIEQIQLHPTVEQTTSMLITESVRGDGAILVNQKGERFTNELLTRDAVSAAELAQEGQYAYIIFDQNLRNNLKAVEKYVTNGLTVQGDTIEELAGKLNIEPEVLAKTLADWNEAVAQQNDAQFGRTTGMNANLTMAPFYAIQIAPGIHHTMGGVKIDTSAEVISTEGNVIPGLFAAGEVTGGVHGGNRLGGNAVADIVIFGRIAADSAVAYCGK